MSEAYRPRSDTSEKAMVSRRDALRFALSGAGAIVLPQSVGATATSERSRQTEVTLAAVSRLPSSDQLRWFGNVLGPKGRFWPMLREGDFSDLALDHLFRSFANISHELNGKRPRDPNIQSIRNRLPDISDIPHTYMLAARMTDGSVRDIGNVQATSYSGRLYLQSSHHVIQYLGKYHPDFYAAFHVPSRLQPQDPPPDVALACLARVPMIDELDRRVVEIPTDFNPREIGGQVNVVVGFKEDGGIRKHAGIVLPTPHAMLERLYRYWKMPPVRTISELETIATIQQGGLMLMPDFFGDVTKQGVRAAGRSGSLRLTYSPKHDMYVPNSNFMAQIGGIRVQGLSLGFVDSASHATRAYSEVDARIRSGAPMPLLSPKPVSGRLDLFEISPNIYLRDFRRNVKAGSPKAASTK